MIDYELIVTFRDLDDISMRGFRDQHDAESYLMGSMRYRVVTREDGWPYPAWILPGEGEVVWARVKGLEAGTVVELSEWTPAGGWEPIDGDAPVSGATLASVEARWRPGGAENGPVGESW